ncbi:MAG: sulfatase [Planctomycetes bacterium]|nr:sulfatase [Planctomycetota bacterium]
MPAFRLSAVLVFANCLVAQEPAKRPNLLILVTDDQRFDSLGCTGNQFVDTPHVDALARDGVNFRQAFVTTPICAASRASILCGSYESAHRFTFGTPPLADSWVDASYPTRLRAAGYRTGFVGKFGVKVPEGATARMFDSFVPLSPPYRKRRDDGTERHLTDLETDRALEFLDGCNAGQPWCLSISFNAPHADDGSKQQYFWPHEQDTVYAQTEFPVPASMDDAFFTRLPAFLRESESRVRFGWRFDTPAKYQDMVRGYHRMIRGVDAAVGRLRQELARRELATDTIVVFTSDNGYFLGERGFADKWYGYELSLRVPMLVYDPRAPGLHRGTTSDHVVLNVDLAPTLLQLAGAEPSAAHQGRSVVPLLAGRAPADWRSEFLFEHRFVHARIPRSEGVRTDRFTYISWLDGVPGSEELYDHRADRDQVHDLVADPGFAATLLALRARTDTLRSAWSTTSTAPR